MATRKVKSSATGAMGINAAKRSRYEKMETAYGKIPAAAYATGDTLVFDQFAAGEIIHGRFVTSGGAELEIFNKTNFSNAVAWGFKGATTASQDINYVIHYKKGTGRVSGPTDVKGDGELLKITVTITQES